MPRPKIYSHYSKDYIEVLFYRWYNKGKPIAARFRKQHIPESDLEEFNLNTLPTAHFLKGLIDDEFAPRAYQMDMQVEEQLDDALVAEKVKMLKRHADIGTEMQNMALNFLRQHGNAELNAPTAVRMLVEGIRIELGSRSIPDALQKMVTKSDEELLADLRRLLKSGEVAPVEAEIQEEEDNG